MSRFPLANSIIRLLGGVPQSERKNLLSGELASYPGIAQFLNPDAPRYASLRDYTKLAQHGYSGNVYLYRGVTIITQSMAGIPWQLYKQDGHPVLNLLNTEANEEDSGPEFLEALVSYWLLAGVTYVWAVRPETGTRAPTKLFAVQPNLLTPDIDRDGTLTRWIFDAGDGHKQYFAPEDILRIKDFHPLARALGLGAAQVAARPLDQHNAANDWNTALLQNMARPSGMLTPKTVGGQVAVIPPDAHETLKEELREKYSGPRNAGRPLVPRAPMEWQSMGQNALDMDWLSGKQQAAKEIAVALGIPPVLLEDKDNATYNNLKEAHRALMTETVLPRMDRLKAALSRFLLPMYGLDAQAYTLDYDRDAIEALAEDEDARHARVRADYAGGLVSLNEAREAVHLDAIDEGDVFLAPARAVTLDQLLEGAGLPTMADGGQPAMPPALPQPGAGKPPQLVPGQIVDANPPNPPGTAAGGKGLTGPFVLPPTVIYSPSARRKRLERAAEREPVTR